MSANAQGGDAQVQETATASANVETQQQPVAASTASVQPENRPSDIRTREIEEGRRDDRRPRREGRRGDGGYDRRRERDYDDDYPRGNRYHREGDERYDRHDSRASAGNSTHVSVAPTTPAPAVPPQTSFWSSPYGTLAKIGIALALLVIGAFFGPKLTGKAAAPAAAPNTAPAQGQPQPADNSTLKPQISGVQRDPAAPTSTLSIELEKTAPAPAPEVDIRAPLSTDIVQNGPDGRAFDEGGARITLRQAGVGADNYIDRTGQIIVVTRCGDLRNAKADQKVGPAVTEEWKNAQTGATQRITFYPLYAADGGFIMCDKGMNPDYMLDKIEFASGLTIPPNTVLSFHPWRKSNDGREVAILLVQDKQVASGNPAPAGY